MVSMAAEKSARIATNLREPEKIVKETIPAFRLALLFPRFHGQVQHAKWIPWQGRISRQL